MGTRAKWAGAIVALVSAGVVLQSSAAAGDAAPRPNRIFDGILKVSPPTGFLISPKSYDISHGPARISFVVVAENLTKKRRAFNFRFSASHILTYNGQDVSDGQPGQPGIRFPNGKGTKQKLLPRTHVFRATWGPSQTKSLHTVRVLNSCGYFQIDIWMLDKHKRNLTLAGGFVRVLGCPTSHSKPVSGGVQAIAIPNTGAVGGTSAIAAAMFSLGIGSVIAGLRRRRTHGRASPAAESRATR